MDPDGAVDLGFMRLVAHFASRAAGCQYCEAHSLIAAEIHGIDQDKIDAIWDYQVSPLYSEAERVALADALRGRPSWLAAAPDESEIPAVLEAHRQACRSAR